MLLHIKTILFSGEGEGTCSEMLLSTDQLIQKLSSPPGRSSEAVAREFASVLNRRLGEVADKVFGNPKNKAWLVLSDGRKLEIRPMPS